MLSYTIGMQFIWKPEKNELLKAERNICFEEIIEAITKGGLIGTHLYSGIKRAHKKQIVLIVKIREEIWKVPVTPRKNLVFMHTAYPVT